MSTVAIAFGTASYSIKTSGSPLVRVGNKLFAFLVYAASPTAFQATIQAFVSTDNGASFTLSDELTTGSTSYIHAAAACNRPDGNIDVIMIKRNTGGFPDNRSVSYSLFNASTGLFGTVTTPQILNIGTVDYYIDCDKVDDRLHVVGANSGTIRGGGTVSTIFYTNYNGSTWQAISAPLGGEHYYPSIIIQGESARYIMVAALDSKGDIDAVRSLQENPSQISIFTIASNIFNVAVATDVAGAINAPQIVQNAVGDTMITVAGKRSGDLAVVKCPLMALNESGRSWSAWNTYNLRQGANPITNTAIQTRGYGGYTADSNVFCVDTNHHRYRFDGYMKFSTNEYMASNLDDITSPAHVKVRKPSLYAPLLDRVEMLIESNDNVYFESIDLNRLS